MAVGFTVCVPPPSGNVYELPSDPATVTFVALAADTDNVDAPPAATVAGLAEMLMIGTALVSFPLTTPHPATASRQANAKNLKETDRQELQRSCGTGKAFPLGYRSTTARRTAFPRRSVLLLARVRPLEPLFRCDMR